MIGVSIHGHPEATRLPVSRPLYDGFIPNASLSNQKDFKILLPYACFYFCFTGEILEENAVSIPFRPSQARMKKHLAEVHAGAFCLLDVFNERYRATSL